MSNDAAGVTTPGAAGRSNSGGSKTSSGTPRTVEETDLYRLEGDRLYFLNAYRGLMVFDVSNVDSPRFLGRSPIYGSPVEMTVHNGVANVVVSDWYGKMDDGTPFHGSIVRGIDASDPANMRITGEAMLGGTVRDTRVVGEVIYAVTERYPWEYGWYGLDGVASRGNGGVAVSSGAKVSVAAVSFANNGVRQVASYDVPGENGVFNVTPNSILLASAELGTPDVNGYAAPTGNSNLTYVDISDPQGSIAVRGKLTFPGYLFGYGTDNGRWNLDFADGATAHVLACGQQYCGAGQDLLLATADFTDPEQPKLLSRVAITANTWSPAVRFDGKRMYLSPAGGYYWGPSGTQNQPTPIQIFDLSNSAAPALKGTVEVTGQIWNFTPAGDRLFALGNDYSPTTDQYGSAVVLHYLDVTDAAAPKALGTAAFGEGWAWTPAAGTFKAFAKNDEQKLVVLPFSGYSSRDFAYNNGLQLIEFTANSITTGASAKTKGWVERGIFVKNRLVSLSDLALSVVDYTNRAAPSVVNELTLARNVVDAKPQGNGTIAELSSDWWGNDVNVAQLRILDAAKVEETKEDATLASLELPGTNARVFHDGSLSYVATQVSRRAACPPDAGMTGAPKDPGTGAEAQCEFWHTRVQVIDRSGEKPVLRGRADLPENNGYGWGWGWGWYGCFAYDWYFGSQFVQVGGDLLAMQGYEFNANDNRWHPVLTTVSLKDPDAPVIGSTAITQDINDWWGNMRAVGDQLYVSHYNWIEQPYYDGQTTHQGSVRFFADRIDLSDPKNPKIGARINVPGVLVGASPSDPNLIYTIDYRWYGDQARNVLAASRVEGDKAYYQGGVEIPGYVGNVIVNDTGATFTVQEYGGAQNPTYTLKLYQANLADPAHPTLRSSTPDSGWGWLLDVQGDRAFVTSGWGDQGVDVFKLSADAPPVFDQFVRTRGWYPGALARDGKDVYFASGYWGTEHVVLK